MFETSRRALLGTSVVGASSLLPGMDVKAANVDPRPKSKIDTSGFPDIPKGLAEVVNFPLIDAIHGRRSRRFAKGNSLPDGPLGYTSKHAAAPLSELEEILLLTTVAGNTGWSNLIPHNRYYAPKIPNYAGAAGGRSFPSSAGFHTSDIFFTNDSGAYYFPTRNMAATSAKTQGGETDLAGYLNEHKSRIVKLSDGRLNIPAQPQHMEMHNEWCSNVPGSTLIMPVGDLAQHTVLALCYLVQNGACLYDDVNDRAIPGIEKYKHLVDVENPYPLSYVEQLCLTEITVELSCACYAGALMLQAMGLGGWMYDGINPFSVLGASGDPNVPGFGFDFEQIEGNPLPHVTGLKGVFEGHCPPHFGSMREAVVSVVERKFGLGGPFNGQTKGPYKETDAVRKSGAPINDEFIDCVAIMAEYVFSEFGRFPATVPAIFSLMYLQAHQLDTGFYDHHFEPGAYLDSHRNHDKNWG